MTNFVVKKTVCIFMSTWMIEKNLMKQHYLKKKDFIVN